MREGLKLKIDGAKRLTLSASTANVEYVLKHHFLHL